MHSILSFIMKNMNDEKFQSQIKDFKIESELKFIDASDSIQFSDKEIKISYLSDPIIEEKILGIILETLRINEIFLSEYSFSCMEEEDDEDGNFINNASFKIIRFFDEPIPQK